MPVFYMMTPVYDGAFGSPIGETGSNLTKYLSTGEPAKEKLHEELSFEFDADLFSAVQRLDLLPCFGEVPIISEKFANFLEERYPQFSETLPVSIMVDGEQCENNIFYALNVLVNGCLIDMDESVARSVEADDGSRVIYGFDKVKLLCSNLCSAPLFRIIEYPVVVACNSEFMLECMKSELSIDFMNLEQVLSAA